MHLCFAANPHRPQTYAVRERLIAQAKLVGFTCSLIEDGGSEGADMLVVSGGDGSLIRYAEQCWQYDMPMLGVHVGRVGFLSECTEEEFAFALERIKSGSYTLDKRTMLACSINGGEKAHCLNDVLVFKHSFSGVAQMELSIDNQSVGTIFGDGIVVATPTGSTAYSLSAGGPIVADGLEAILVTPICPHTLHMRPIVASMNALVRIEVIGNGVVAADGERIAEVETGDSIELGRSDRTVSFVRFGKQDLFDRIQKKLR